MFQKFLLTIIAIFVALTWFRYLFAKDNTKNKVNIQDNQNNNSQSKPSWFKQKFSTQTNKKTEIEALEECPKCGVFFSKTSSRNSCPHCQSKVKV